MNKKISSKTVEGGESRFLNTSDGTARGEEREVCHRDSTRGCWDPPKRDLTPQGKPSRQSADKLHCVGTFMQLQKEELPCTEVLLC